MFDQQRANVWLDGLVGDWSSEFATADNSDHPGFSATGTETVRRVGPGLLLESQSVGSDGSQSRSVTLICADVEKGRITSAVMGTAVDTLFVSAGEITADGRTMTLETEGPAMTPNRETDRYRDVFVVESTHVRYTAAELLRDDGSWQEFMRTTYRRNA